MYLPFSSTAVGVLPTFLTIAPIRHYWFEAKAPIFLVLQRFCDHGYHSNYFKITPNQISNRDGVDDFWAASYDFKIEVARQDDPELNSMNICVIANSVNGTPNAAQDLIKLITSGSERAHHHNDAQCSDNVKVVNEMLNASVDEMFMTFFAQHCNVSVMPPYRNTVCQSDILRHDSLYQSFLLFATRSTHSPLTIHAKSRAARASLVTAKMRLPSHSTRWRAPLHCTSWTTGTTGTSS